MTSPPFAEELTVIVAAEHRADIGQATDPGCGQLPSANTLITVAPPLSGYVTLAGVSQETMQAELDTWAAGILDETVRTLPDDLVAHTVQHSGHPGPRVVRELERGGCDLIVLGTRGRGTREKEEALSWQMTTRTSTE